MGFTCEHCNVAETKRSQFCEACLYDMGYEIRESILDGSGLGVFTTKDFNENQINLRYDGIIIDPNQWNELSYEDSAYVMAFEGRGRIKEFYVAAIHPNSCVARYINHGGSITSNVKQKFEEDKIFTKLIYIIFIL